MKINRRAKAKSMVVKKKVRKRLSLVGMTKKKSEFDENNVEFSRQGSLIKDGIRLGKKGLRLITHKESKMKTMETIKNVTSIHSSAKYIQDPRTDEKR